MWPWLAGGVFSNIKWHEWFFFALLVASLSFQVFGVVRYFYAASDPNARRTFRNWRTNFLTQSTHMLLQIASFTTWMIVVYIAREWFSRRGDFVFQLVGLVLAGFGLWLTFFNQNWWWNYDELGMLRHEKWVFFASDRFFDEDETEETAEDDENELATEEDIDEF